jgi:hypothetical protein
MTASMQRGAFRAAWALSTSEIPKTADAHTAPNIRRAIISRPPFGPSGASDELQHHIGPDMRGIVNVAIEPGLRYSAASRP